MMKNRAPTNSSIDGNYFTRTAQKVKAVNIPGKIYRGGIRF